MLELSHLTYLKIEMKFYKLAFKKNESFQTRGSLQTRTECSTLKMVKFDNYQIQEKDLWNGSLKYTS